MPRGGTRAGAGRKKSPGEERSRLFLRLDSDFLARIDEARQGDTVAVAGDGGTSRAEFLRKAIADYLPLLEDGATFEPAAGAGVIPFPLELEVSLRARAERLVAAEKVPSLAELVRRAGLRVADQVLGVPA